MAGLNPVDNDSTPAQAFASGRIGKCTINGTDYHLTNWDIDPTASTSETTNTGTGGHDDHIINTVGLSGSLTLNWDVNNQPVPTCMPGNLIYNLTLQIGDSGGTVVVNQALITGTPIVNPVKGVVEVTVNWLARGAFQMAGNASAQFAEIGTP